MMHEDSALHGMSVLIPRSKEQAEANRDLILSLGGEPVLIPLISFRETAAAPALKELDLNDFHWIVFTSSVTVEVFFTYVSRNVFLPKVAVIGQKTAEKLAQFGVEADFIPSAFVAETFVPEFLAILDNEQNVLIPKGNLARDFIKQELVASRHEVREIILYENYFPEKSRQSLSKRLKQDGIDILLFTSPSTVDHFMEVVKFHHLEKEISNSIIGCIGPIAETRVKHYGLQVHAVPQVYTFRHLIMEVVKVISS